MSKTNGTNGHGKNGHTSNGANCVNGVKPLAGLKADLSDPCQAKLAHAIERTLEAVAAAAKAQPAQPDQPKSLQPDPLTTAARPR